MKMYMGLDFKNYQQNPFIMEVSKEFDSVDMTKPKIQKRLEKLRINKIKELFEKGNFNLELFQYACKDYFKRKDEEEKKKKEQEKEAQDLEKPKSWIRQMFGVEFGLQILVLFILFALFWYWNKNSLFSSTPAFSKGNNL